MGRSLNKTTLIGNIGSDPDVRYSPEGKCVVQLSVATSESWKDKNTGEQKKITDWHRVKLFGKPAEFVSQYLHKGSKVYVEGKLKTRKWQDQNGTDHYTTEVVIDDFKGEVIPLDPPPATGAQAHSGSNQQAQPQSQAVQRPAAQPQQAPANQRPQQQRQPQPQQQPQAAHAGAGGFGDFDDDIPFDLYMRRTVI